MGEVGAKVMCPAADMPCKRCTCRIVRQQPGGIRLLDPHCPMHGEDASPRIKDKKRLESQSYSMGAAKVVDVLIGLTAGSPQITVPTGARAYIPSNPSPCPVCDMNCFDLESHIAVSHPPYREPWWLRVLRWIVNH